MVRTARLWAVVTVTALALGLWGSRGAAAEVVIGAAPVVTYVRPAPVVTYVQPVPVVTSVQPAPVVTYVQPVPVITYVSPVVQPAVVVRRSYLVAPRVVIEPRVRHHW